MNGLTAAETALLSNGNGFGGNDSWVFFIFLLLIAGGTGFGGNKEQVATSADVQRGFDTNSIINKLDGITNGICDSTFALNNSIKDGNYATQLGISNLGYSNQMGFASVNSAIQDCCCKTNASISEVRNDICKQTYEITNAIQAEGDATRALINANTIQDLRDKVNDKDREIQSAQFQISQVSQTSNILNSLGKYTPFCGTPCCY